MEKGLHTVLGRVTLCLSKLIERGSSKSEPPDAKVQELAREAGGPQDGVQMCEKAPNCSVNA